MFPSRIATAGEPPRAQGTDKARLRAAWAQLQAHRRQLLAMCLGAVVMLGWLWLGLPAGSLHMPQRARRAPAAAGGGRARPAGPWPTAGDTIHVLITANGKPYVNWQTLALYGTFLRAQRMPGGDKMAAFTRILTRHEDDALSPVVPTWRSDPLVPGCGHGGPGRCPYVVAERPTAVLRFLVAAEQDPSLIQAPWLCLMESDFAFIRPLQAPGPAESGVTSLAFEYQYIAPTAPGLQPFMRQLYPPGLGPVSDIVGSGPSPVLARVAEWVQVAPRWEGLTQQMEADPAMVKKLGWVREMYAWSVAVAVERLKLDYTPPPDNRLMIQVPVDYSLGKAAMIHYTWGPHVWDVHNGTLVWKFEKREIVGERVEKELPKPDLPPPFRPGAWTTKPPDMETAFRRGPLERELYDTFVQLIQALRDGIDEDEGSDKPDETRAGLSKQPASRGLEPGMPFTTSPMTPAFTRRREHVVGRVAALGFAFGLMGELLTGVGPITQLHYETGLSFRVIYTALLVLAGFGLVGGLRPGSPTYDNRNLYDASKRTSPPNPVREPRRFLMQNEVYIGRLAMVGFAGAVALEYLWGGEAPLAHLGLIQPGTPLAGAPLWAIVLIPTLLLCGFGAFAALGDPGRDTENY
ncbi:hypothetical protein C2E20_2633 [Micractinium conductrix]|uniref:Hydroxyproline O-arabinosyltransferase-like domain-containing protein n=1 Tax=Micractinium conductrix TaxID=554055 RepID=A0A2P6VJ36_9CHLO|nr:hypothetical protein C2E20_2633 [Micractinium conductrix]|eukprot:PSC74116.1 hypothetical protein C2E20_2633 [Micractinium conductrix]